MPWPNDEHLRVVFRRSCYGCKIASGSARTGDVTRNGWHRSMGGHRWEWEYRIRWNGVTVSTRIAFATFERAHLSMERTIERLDTAGVIRAPERVA